MSRARTGLSGAKSDPESTFMVSVSLCPTNLRAARIFSTRSFSTSAEICGTWPCRDRTRISQRAVLLVPLVLPHSRAPAAESAGLGRAPPEGVGRVGQVGLVGQVGRRRLRESTVGFRAREISHGAQRAHRVAVFESARIVNVDSINTFTRARHRTDCTTKGTKDGIR